MMVHGCAQGPPGDEASLQVIPLPDPRLSGPFSLEEVVLSRRSVRAFRPDSLGLPLVSQLLWAAQGITDDRGLRSAPSAGATFPLEVLVVTGREEGLAPGVYRYRPRSHDLQRIGVGDVRRRLARAALDQTWMTEAPVWLVLVADFSRTTARYGDRLSLQGVGRPKPCVEPPGAGASRVCDGSGRRPGPPQGRGRRGRRPARTAVSRGLRDRPPGRRG